MGRSAGALTDHELLTPLTKKVSRVPVSWQNWANAPTTATLVPSSTVSAIWFPSPGSRVSTPAGAGTRPMGIFHRTGAAPAATARLAAASTVTAMAHSIVRRSMYCMRSMLLSSRTGGRFSFLLRLELSATGTRPAGVGCVGERGGLPT